MRDHFLAGFHTAWCKFGSDPTSFTSFAEALDYDYEKSKLSVAAGALVWFCQGFYSGARRYASSGYTTGPEYSQDLQNALPLYKKGNPEMSPADQKKANFKALLESKPLEFIRAHAQNGATEMDLLYSGCATSEEYDALLQQIIISKLEASPNLSGPAARIQLCITEGRGLIDQAQKDLALATSRLSYLLKQYDRIEAILKTPGALNHG